MADGHKTPLRAIRLPEQLSQAVDAYCKRHKITFSTLVRQTVADAIGRPELGEDPKMGRPAKVKG